MPQPDNLNLSFAVVFGEQLRVAAASIGRETAFVPALFAAFGAFLITQFSVGGDSYSVPLEPGHLLATLPLAVLLPWSVWKPDPVFGRAFLWTLPVSRQRSMVARVVAGGVCLIAALLILLPLVALLTSGFNRAAAASWQWIAPFFAHLIVYVAASAAMLGVKRKVRWVALLFAIWLFLALLVGTLPGSTVAPVVKDALNLWSGRFGPNHVLTGGSGGVAVLGHWIEATLLWAAAALGALMLAMRRHREG